MGWYRNGDCRILAVVDAGMAEKLVFNSLRLN